MTDVNKDDIIKKKISILIGQASVQFKQLIKTQKRKNHQ